MTPLQNNGREGIVFCPNCGNQYQGSPRFCENCGLALGPRQAEGTNEPRFLDWFRNHLNWTLVIALILITAVTFIAGFLAGYYIQDDDAFYGVFWLIVAGNLILTAIAGAWVLNQKSRSLLWLLLSPFWIGWIIWLALDNRKQAMGQLR